MTVLKHHEIRLTKRGDTPQYVEEEPEAYTQVELDALFKVCKPDHHLLFSFYLESGFSHAGSDVPEVVRHQLRD